MPGHSITDISVPMALPKIISCVTSLVNYANRYVHTETTLVDKTMHPHIPLA